SFRFDSLLHWCRIDAIGCCFIFTGSNPPPSCWDESSQRLLGSTLTAQSPAGQHGAVLHWVICLDWSGPFRKCCWGCATGAAPDYGRVPLQCRERVVADPKGLAAFVTARASRCAHCCWIVSPLEASMHQRAGLQQAQCSTLSVSHQY